MEIGESIAVAAVKQNPSEPCWFCEAEPKHPSKKNEEKADPETADADDEEPGEVPEND